MGILAANPNAEDLAHVGVLVERGELSPAVDRAFSLREVPEALRALGAGEALGKLVIRL